MDYRVTITQTGKHQTTLFVLSVSTDSSLHCLLVCLVVKYPVHHESQKLGPSVSRCVEYTALCCNCDFTRTSILSVSVLTTSLEISPQRARSLPVSSPVSPSLSLFPPLLSLPSSSFLSLSSHFLLLSLSIFPVAPPGIQTSELKFGDTERDRQRERETETEIQRERQRERQRQTDK